MVSSVFNTWTLPMALVFPLGFLITAAVGSTCRAVIMGFTCEIAGQLSVAKKIAKSNCYEPTHGTKKSPGMSYDMAERRVSKRHGYGSKVEHGLVYGLEQGL